MKILFLMTARGGSKGIPGKNLRELSGISLVGFKSIGAKRSKYCTRLVISTDSQAIQTNALRFGVEVPFTRPAELASDTATSSQVIDHAIGWFEERGEKYDAIMLLEPSAPFTRPSDYDNAVELMIAHSASAVIGMKPAEVNSTFVAPMDEQGRLTALIDKMKQAAAGRRQENRQELRQEYTASGALYLFRWDYFKEHRDIYYDRENTFGYTLEHPYWIEIDKPIDLQWAEFLVQCGRVDLRHWQ